MTGRLELLRSQDCVSRRGGPGPGAGGGEEEAVGPPEGADWLRGARGGSGPHFGGCGGADWVTAVLAACPLAARQAGAVCLAMAAGCAHSTGVRAVPRAEGGPRGRLCSARRQRPSTGARNSAAYGA